MYKIKMLFFARFRDDLGMQRLNSDFADHFTQYTWKWIYLMFQFLKLFLTASLQRCFPTLCKDGLRTFALILLLFSDAIIIIWYYCITQICTIRNMDNIGNWWHLKNITGICHIFFECFDLWWTINSDVEWKLDEHLGHLKDGITPEKNRNT